MTFAVFAKDARERGEVAIEAPSLDAARAIVYRAARLMQRPAIGERLNPGHCPKHDWTDEQLAAQQHSSPCSGPIYSQEQIESRRVVCLCVTRCAPTQRFLADLRKAGHTCRGTVAGATLCQKCLSRATLAPWKPFEPKLADAHTCEFSISPRLIEGCRPCQARLAHIRNMNKPYVFPYWSKGEPSEGNLGSRAA